MNSITTFLFVAIGLVGLGWAAGPFVGAPIVVGATKVVRSALQHAASVGSLMITAEAMVAERQEKSSGGDGSPGDAGY